MIRLRQGYYTFPEYKSQPDYILYFANRIYRPSYISLHTALAFYGLIPEAVVQVTSITSLKTASFENEFAAYDYRTVQQKLIFGYVQKPMADGKTLLLAQPEKALLDLLYLYPFYTSEQDMEELRLDEDFLEEEFDFNRLEEYKARFKNKALEKRVRIFLNTYGL